MQLRGKLCDRRPGDDGNEQMSFAARRGDLLQQRVHMVRLDADDDDVGPLQELRVGFCGLDAIVCH